MDKRKIEEAEWETSYVNGLPDSAFAVIEPGGEKDEQGKTTPRSLRHLEHHNAQGNVDEVHVKAGLQRLDQTKISDALKVEAKKHLCGHAKQMDFVSEFCGEEPQQAKEKSPCEKAKETLSERVKVLEGQIAELTKPKPEANVAASLVKNPPKTIAIGEVVKMLESVMPPAMAEKSWGFGPQRFCQEIHGVIFRLQERAKSQS